MNDLNKPNIDVLLDSSDTNGSIVALDNYICELCNWGESLEVLSAEQKIFYFNQELEREINNGGFDQYFLNSSGSYAHATIESLQVVGAIITARLLQQAVDQFPNGTVPMSTEERRELIQKLWPDSSNEIWEELDLKFYAYQDNLNELNLAYVRANREAF